MFEGLEEFEGFLVSGLKSFLFQVSCFRFLVSGLKSFGFKEFRV